MDVDNKTSVAVMLCVCFLVLLLLLLLLWWLGLGCRSAVFSHPGLLRPDMQPGGAAAVHADDSVALIN